VLRGDVIAPRLQPFLHLPMIAKKQNRRRPANRAGDSGQQKNQNVFICITCTCLF
jgi:hypothetical protein